MMGEKADLSSWELKDSGLTAGQPALDQTRPPVYGRQLYSLICLRYSCQWDQDLSIGHQLAFGSSFLVVGCLTQSWCRGTELDLPQLN